MIIFRGLLLLAVSVVVVIGQTTTTNTRQVTFPPTGLGSTETAEIILVNNANNTSSGTAASCSGTVSFLNASGATIGTASPFTLTSGQSSVTRLAFSAAGLTAPRGSIRPLVQVNVPTTTPRPPCSLALSFAVFDTTTGATHAVISSSDGIGFGGRY